jgi:hypothetical protein
LAEKLLKAYAKYILKQRTKIEKEKQVKIDGGLT